MTEEVTDIPTAKKRADCSLDDWEAEQVAHDIRVWFASCGIFFVLGLVIGWGL